ncbi:MAG: lipoyl synthase [Myxococcota bacterium]
MTPEFEAVAALGLGFAVVTCVARDDLPDGGAGQMAATVRAIQERCPDTGIEALIADYKGEESARRAVLEAGPDVLNHNLETVERLQRRVRPAAGYERSLAVRRRARELSPEIPTQSGLMLGLGEWDSEVAAALADLRTAGVSLLTLRQYLQPSPAHLPVARYVPPAEFDAWAQRARELGFAEVAAGPLVRSSYRTERFAGFTEQARAERRRGRPPPSRPPSRGDRIASRAARRRDSAASSRRLTSVPLRTRAPCARPPARSVLYCGRARSSRSSGARSSAGSSAPICR